MATPTPSTQRSSPVGSPPAAKTRSSARHALTLMIGTLASRVSGLVRTALLLQLFPSHMTDAFLVAWKIPNLFRELLAEGALTNSFIPVYASLAQDEAKRLAGALFALLALVNGALVAVAIWSAPWLVNLILAEGSAVDAALAIRLTRIIFPVLAAISLSALAMGILNAEERFFAPAWAPVALNVVVIGAMLIFPGQVSLLAVGVVLGGVAQLLVQLPSLTRGGLMPRFGRLWHPSLGGVLLLMAPFAFTTGARQFLNVVANYLLSTMPSGSITAFENTNLIVSLALGLFSVSPALAYYSRLSSNAAHAPHEFKHTLLAGLRFITFLTVPVGLLTYLLAEPAVTLIWGWRLAEGQAQTLHFTALAVAPIGFLIFPLGLNNLLLRPFYVRKRVRVPVVVTMIFVALNSLLYSYLAPRYGIVGLSWGIAATNWLQLMVLLYWMKRDEDLALGAFVSYALRVWLGAILAVTASALVLGRITFPEGQLGTLMHLVTGGGVAALLYALISALLGLPELRQLVRRFRG